MFTARCTCLVVIIAIGGDALGQQPARKDSCSFNIQCKVTRATVENDAKGRPNLERTVTTLPDIITLENARAEFMSERRIQAGIYQFRIQAQIQKIAEGKVRIDMQLEDMWSEGDLEKPVVRRLALQTSRQTSLGTKLKIALQEKNDKDEGVWIDLTIKELMDDE